MPPRRRRIESAARQDLFTDYWPLVNGEKWRSERHNRFFVIFGLTADNIGEGELGQLVQHEIRASDSIFMMKDQPNQTSSHSLKLGILLPETNMAGAEVVKTRLENLFMVQGIPLQMGKAGYPDDATVPEQLLAMAFDPAQPERLL